MLVLSRQRDETIMIGDEVEVTIVDIRGDKVRLGITAPKEITVHRKEVYEAIKRENRAAAQVRPEDLDSAAASRAPGPKLAGSADQGREPRAFDPDKPMVRPTLRASMPRAIRPQKPDRNQPRPQQERGEAQGPGRDLHSPPPQQQGGSEDRSPPNEPPAADSST